jgi:hypothetical protein
MRFHVREGIVPVMNRRGDNGAAAKLEDAIGFQRHDKLSPRKWPEHMPIA